MRAAEKLFLGAFAQLAKSHNSLRRACYSIFLSVRLYAFISASSTEWIFVEFDIGDFCEKSVVKIQIWVKYKYNNSIGHFTQRLKCVHFVFHRMGKQNQQLR
jgi:hypothetical protein